nr:hypothetical protein [Pleurocapsa sp. MO_226.B13]
MTDSYGLISLFPILICINTIWQISQNWSQFWDAQVTESDRQLAQQSAIFILIPLGVLLHEIGHSLATWQVGGTVTTFRWLFFSGYIIPSGNFSTVEYWWIVFAGNLLSICLGLIPILLIPRIRKRIIAEVLYWFACMQSIYALILYPLWSALSRSGDWVQIYNFAIAPYAKLVLVAHLALLWGLWRLYCSQKVVEWRLARSSDALATWHQLLLEGANRPNDLQPQMELGYFLLQHQEIREAKKIATKINRLKPNEPRVKLCDIRPTPNRSITVQDPLSPMDLAPLTPWGELRHYMGRTMG